MFSNRTSEQGREKEARRSPFGSEVPFLAVLFQSCSAALFQNMGWQCKQEEKKVEKKEMGVGGGTAFSTVAIDHSGRAGERGSGSNFTYKRTMVVFSSAISFKLGMEGEPHSPQPVSSNVVMVAMSVHHHSKSSGGGQDLSINSTCVNPVKVFK